MDSIEFNNYTNVVIDMKTRTRHSADSTSRRWLGVFSDCNRTVSSPPRTFELKSPRHFIGNVRGTIIDDINEPIPGANIVVKGTMIGTIADVNGNFALDIPEDPATIVITFIGYKTEEIEVRAGSVLTIAMEADVAQLSEVVVVGYGEQRKSSLAFSVATLNGKVAGIAINPGENKEETETVQDENDESNAERELYAELMTLNRIRSKFSDVGFWEPRLFTDRHGVSKFAVTFPDDITRWDATVFAMNARLQTGTARKSIKSYKPLMAELHVPQFLTVGDTAKFIGKVLNYTSDKAINGKTKWSSSISQENQVTFNGFHSERFSITANVADTIKTNYSFTRDDGYFDGEERKVPVVEQGTIRANGTLDVLKNNDEIHLKGKKGSMLKLEIFDNPIELYAQDVRYLINYKYDCNEQLASKLLGFLNYKLLMQYEGKPFRHDKDVNKIIQRLLKNQNSEFLWSWWDVSPNTSYWMSAHILRALSAAKNAGYLVNLDVENLQRKASYKYDYLNDITLADVQMVHALALWNADVNYARYVKVLDRSVQKYDSIARVKKKRYGYTHYSSITEKMMLMEIRQLQHLPFVRDSLLRYKKQTILNEVYFTDGHRANYWYVDNLSNNSIAYRIVSRDPELRQLATSMQLYFLNERKKNSWNTYEASNVLMSILPDLIAQGSTKKTPATVSLAGKTNQTITTFPFRHELNENEELHIKKESGAPLYCIQYTEERVTTAQAGTDAFTISTRLDEKVLKAGKPTTLKATIEVKRDTKLEHVMIEIPIPAACSYADKSQRGNRIETHREYFKEKAVIFCENMSEGTYNFHIELLPRFTGKYIINPAQVSLMYIPVINANTDLKKVSVEE